MTGGRANAAAFARLLFTARTLLHYPSDQDIYAEPIGDLLDQITAYKLYTGQVGEKKYIEDILF